MRQSSHGPEPDYFEATSHTRKIGKFPTLADAKKKIEEDLESGMRKVLHDWEIYQQNKAK